LAVLFLVLWHFGYKQLAVLANFWQHLTLSILANFQNGDQQKMANSDDERVSKFQLQRPSQKKIRYAFSFYFRDGQNYRLVSSGNGQLSTCIRVILLCGQAFGLTDIILFAEIFGLL